MQTSEHSPSPAVGPALASLPLEQQFAQHCLCSPDSRPLPCSFTPGPRLHSLTVSGSAVSHPQAHLESLPSCRNTVLPGHLLSPPASPSLQCSCERSPEPFLLLLCPPPPPLFSWPAWHTPPGNQDKPVSPPGTCIRTGLKAWAPSVAAFRDLPDTSSK